MKIDQQQAFLHANNESPATSIAIRQKSLPPAAQPNGASATITWMPDGATIRRAPAQLFATFRSFWKVRSAREASSPARRIETSAAWFTFHSGVTDGISGLARFFRRGMGPRGPGWSLFTGRPRNSSSGAASRRAKGVGSGRRNCFTQPRCSRSMGEHRAHGFSREFGLKRTRDETNERRQIRRKSGHSTHFT